MRPLIGIVGRRATKSSVLRYSGTVAAETLLDAVLRAGGEPVILHGGAAADMAELPERVARFDGIVLPGGGDLNPGRYSATRSPECEIPDDQQDAFDLAVIRAALGTATPDAGDLPGTAGAQRGLRRARCGSTSSAARSSTRAPCTR